MQKDSDLTHVFFPSSFREYRSVSNCYSFHAASIVNMAIHFMYDA